MDADTKDRLRDLAHFDVDRHDHVEAGAAESADETALAYAAFFAWDKAMEAGHAQESPGFSISYRAALREPYRSAFEALYPIALRQVRVAVKAAEREAAEDASDEG